MLEVSQLHKYYGSFHAVKGISFSVEKGEIVGFLGPNGAGKTTTMKIITGFMSMSSGSVSVDGYDVSHESLQVRKEIGYLPENAPLYEDMTVTEYLSFMASMRCLRGAERSERLNYVIGVCGLDPKRRSVIRTLSKGFRQRTGLAQAIIHQPRLVILDEPTVGLDPNQIIGIRELLREVGEDNTVVLSSHILSEVEATCSRVMIIDDGHIVANGTPKELQSEHGGNGLEDTFIKLTRTPDAEPEPVAVASEDVDTSGDADGEEN
jgi:ABC-2 type transport system ATP-binding protein